jgi:hypothetical protein
VVRLFQFVSHAVQVVADALAPSVAQMNAQCTPKRVLVLQSVLNGIALLQ